MWGELHEEKQINVSLPSVISAGKANRLFSELGATLHYDVYSFKADRNEIWQSESILYIELKCEGNRVYAQDDFDEIVLVYPFATRPSSDQKIALNLITNIMKSFKAEACYNGKPLESSIVQEDWDLCADFLLKEWGEEPGSESLRIMIEENYA
ncbi:hypothetical protein [Vibrio europaeus]|uniref:hypothetical protein n=1 Tax=Vibrio europaeus TaxID=300876 RepID=UPI00233F3F38|nr:hypothetical protein [Vibrio europaeus]MDC5840271.1 hypothetical protein [Vibrio europaeus]MDC5857358.1 hypothetical protein [Vibrio europaeus]